MSEPNIVVKTLQSKDFRDQLLQLLPPEVPVDRFIRTALNAVQANPQVLNADRQSLYLAIHKAASWNLMCDGRQGALVVYNTKDGPKVQFMVMVAGVITLLDRAGYSCYATSVYEAELDDIKIWNDNEGQHLEHKIRPFYGDRGARVGAYAVAKHKETGLVSVATMTMEELSRVRAASRAKDKQGNPVGPWADWPEQMEQKSAIHRLVKRLNLTIDPEQITVLDPEEGALEPAATTVESEKPSTPRPKAIQAMVDKANERDPDQQQEAPLEPSGQWGDDAGLDL